MSEAEPLSNKDVVMELDDTLGISDISTLLSSLKNVAAEKKNVTIRANKVNSIDAASLQLLAIFSKTIQAQGCEINLEDPSELFQQNSKLLDFSKCFQKAV